MARAKGGVKCTPEVVKKITGYLRGGGFEHVAAEAAGVPRKTFAEWMALGSPTTREGRRRRPHKLYTPLWLGVMQAKATARLTAEVEALREDPIRWLTSGPGKERLNDPGWSATPRPVMKEEREGINPLLSVEMQGLYAALLQVLAPFPEARLAVAQAFAEAGKRGVKEGSD